MQTFLGLLLGCILTYSLLEFGYTPPSIFNLPTKIKSIPEQLIASSFIAIDNASDNQFTKGAINKITERRAKLAKSYSAEIASLLASDDHPNLKQHIIARYQTSSVNELQVKVLIEKINQDDLLHKELKKRYEGLTDEQIAKQILQISER